MERIAAPLVAAERPMLEGWLEFERATLALKCAGLAPEQLATRSVPPATLSLLGLVRHMAEVERFWFQRCLVGADRPPIYRTDAERDRAFDGAEPASAAEDLAAWEEECAASRSVVAGIDSLDTIGADSWRDSEVSLRWILVHMIEEYARHNGHADLLRQTIDGAVGV
ncbi:MAG: DinB family protein [Acidimicrobiales bacterium]